MYQFHLISYLEFNEMFSEPSILVLFVGDWGGSFSKSLTLYLLYPIGVLIHLATAIFLLKPNLEFIESFKIIFLFISLTPQRVEGDIILYFSLLECFFFNLFFPRLIAVHICYLNNDLS